MERSYFYVVTDDVALAEKARQWGLVHGLTVQVYSTVQWTQGMNDPAFRGSLRSDTQLLPGLQPSSSDSGVGGTSNVLPFPSNGSQEGRRVATINEMESLAIENAIYEYNGNLTEAARALGIGRATLYRKVKQYNIDPSAARKKRRVA